MKPNAWTKTAVAAGMALAAALVLAQPTAGAGMMRGDCYGGERGDGGGPGMMRGYGGAGGWGGSGMMRGYGGAGRWGGSGMMRGHDGALALGALGLSAGQQEKIAAIHEDMRRRTWDTMGTLRGEQFKLRSLFRADKPDPDAVAAQQKKVDELRLAMVKAHVAARNQMLEVLTSEQRERLREDGPWWMDEDDD